MLQSAVVRTENGDTEPAEIGRGVRQGCLLSRMVADSEEGLQRLMDALSEIGKQYDMKINVKKTKVMRVCRKGSKKEGGNPVNITIDGQVVEQVNQFRYLGSLISDDGTCLAEIKSRIAMAKKAFNKRRELLTKRMSTKLKKKVIKTVVWSVALYGSETWTNWLNEKDKLEAFEMWTWRNMEGINWKDHVKNEEMLNRVDEKRQILDVILTRKKRWLGHILRRESLVKDVLEGRFEGERRRGRPPAMMLDDILGNESYATIKRRAMDREGWRKWMPRTCPRAEH
ncbi:unnamed protein product [Didymodactylos carnosus]|uniref:Reverse transcriptase domain-containing protein n=1 Tax=Didymodactylos carnosus TaxID=1234261 RepID=A0A815SYS5_9BILA|nr:unnamed protein product [Didymodactylos carnosus]CAF4358611.1 unnamed protein product [Didymodactylos carnosus]